MFLNSGGKLENLEEAHVWCMQNMQNSNVQLLNNKQDNKKDFFMFKVIKY